MITSPLPGNLLAVARFSNSALKTPVGLEFSSLTAKQFSHLFSSPVLAVSPGHWYDAFSSITSKSSAKLISLYAVKLPLYFLFSNTLLERKNISDGFHKLRIPYRMPIRYAWYCKTIPHQDKYKCELFQEVTSFWYLLLYLLQDK